MDVSSFEASSEWLGSKITESGSAAQLPEGNAIDCCWPLCLFFRC